MPLVSPHAAIQSEISPLHEHPFPFTHPSAVVPTCNHPAERYSARISVLASCRHPLYMHPALVGAAFLIPNVPSDSDGPRGGQSRLLRVVENLEVAHCKRFLRSLSVSSLGPPHAPGRQTDRRTLLESGVKSVASVDSFTAPLIQVQLFYVFHVLAQPPSDQRIGLPQIENRSC
jgi:hypothetical protein